MLLCSKTYVWDNIHHALSSFVYLLIHDHPLRKGLPYITPGACRFSYSQLRLAIDRFYPANKLAQGGFGSIYRAHLLGFGLTHGPQLVAVKRMNKLALATVTSPCDLVVSLLGFSFDRRHCLLLVYELMSNRSLQDALLDRHSLKFIPWSRQFSVALDFARSLLFFRCDPPIIHNSMKPLLDLRPKSCNHPEYSQNEFEVMNGSNVHLRMDGLD